jgi:hypothetical protein
VGNLGHAGSACFLYECGELVMFTISVDATGPIKAMQEMLDLIKAFPNEMARELTDWQTQDMHRTKGTNTALKDLTAETLVTQHTAGSTIKSRSVVRQPRRKMREMKFKVLRQPRGLSAAKPVIRPMLIDKLDERMKMLLTQELQWR